MSIFGGLDRLPGSSSVYDWADWFEILAFNSAMEGFSVSEFSETVERREDYGETETQDNVDDALREEDPLFGGSVGSASDDDGVVGTQSGFRDKVVARSEEVFRYLEARSQAFGNSYPFSVDSEALIISVEDLTPARKAYVFLLACASLRYVPCKSVATGLTAAFEHLSLEAMRCLVPPTAEVHLFGKNPQQLDGGLFSAGRLVDKIRLLADKLGERVLFDDDEFERRDSGDNGLDIVAWTSLGDDLNGRMVYFGQCACTAQWVSKQHSSSHDAWSPVMSFMASPMNLCFIPHDFRRVDRTWWSAHNIHKTVLMDRWRLLKAVEGIFQGHENEQVLEELSRRMMFDNIALSLGAEMEDI